MHICDSARPAIGSSRIKSLYAIVLALWLPFWTGIAAAQSTDTSARPAYETSALSADEAGEILQVFFAGDVERLSALLSRGAIAQKVLPAGEPLIAAAARYGSTAQVKLLLEAGGVANVRGPEGWTPLLTAISVRRLETIKLLLQNGADPSARADDGTTPLDLAQATGDAAIVVAIALALPQEMPEVDRISLLHLAAASGDVNSVKTLVPLLTNVDAMDERGWTALMYATAGGHLEVLKLLLQARAKPNHVARNGITPLMVAAHTGNGPVAAALLAAGASAAARNDFGETAGAIALASGPSELTKLLGVQPGPASFHQQLAAAAARKDLDAVKRLLDSGAPAARPASATGDTPAIVAAACAGESSTIRLLAQRGAGLGEKDPNGVTPLIAAVLCGQLEAVRTLAQLKAPAQDKTKGGIDAVTAAIARGNGDILAALSPVAPPTIETAIQFLQRRDMKTLALLLRENPDLAQRQNRVELAQKAIALNDSAILEQVLALLLYDVNYTPPGSDGSLLLYAIETKRTNSIKTLLKLGAQPTKSIRNVPPFTALEATVMRGNQEAVQAVSQAAKSRVASIQATLASMGYLSTAADGTWGPGSQAALEKFRADHTVKLSENLEDAVSVIASQHLRICNQTGSQINYARYMTGRSGDRLNGWWQLEPGQCKPASILRDTITYYFYVSEVALPGSGMKLCTSQERISETEPEKMKPPCRSGFRESQFVKVTDTTKPFVVR